MTVSTRPARCWQRAIRTQATAASLACWLQPGAGEIRGLCGAPPQCWPDLFMASVAAERGMPPCWRAAAKRGLVLEDSPPEVGLWGMAAPALRLLASAACCSCLAAESGCASMSKASTCPLACPFCSWLGDSSSSTGFTSITWAPSCLPRSWEGVAVPGPCPASADSRSSPFLQPAAVRVSQALWATSALCTRAAGQRSWAPFARQVRKAGPHGPVSPVHSVGGSCSAGRLQSSCRGALAHVAHALPGADHAVPGLRNHPGDVAHGHAGGHPRGELAHVQPVQRGEQPVDDQPRAQDEQAGLASPGLLRRAGRSSERGSARKAPTGDWKPAHYSKAAQTLPVNITACYTRLHDGNPGCGHTQAQVHWWGHAASALVRSTGRPPLQTGEQRGKRHLKHGQRVPDGGLAPRAAAVVDGVEEQDADGHEDHAARQEPDVPGDDGDPP